MPAAKGSETHVIPNDRYPGGGLIDASGRTDELIDAVASDVELARAGNRRLSVYERLHPTFRFFVQFTLVKELPSTSGGEAGRSGGGGGGGGGGREEEGREESREDKSREEESREAEEGGKGKRDDARPTLAHLVSSLFRVIGHALRPEVHSEDDAFYPQLDVSSLRLIAVHDGCSLRLTLPGIVVDASRALQLHRRVLDCMQAHLEPKEKRMLMPCCPRIERGFAVLSLDAWKGTSPSSVYLDEMGMPLCGTVSVERCTAVSKRGKFAHRQCDECRTTGFVPKSERLEVVAVMDDARNPRPDVDAMAYLRSDAAAALRATSLRADARPHEPSSSSSSSASSSSPLTEPYVVPSYAPVVPMQVDKRGRSELVDCLECERSAFGPPPRSAPPRQEYDALSNNFAVISAMMATQAACRKMHPSYRQVTIKKMYKVYVGAYPVVRVLVDGPNATFCMNKQRPHTGPSACRASFTFEQVRGRVRMVQECYSPECVRGKKRYCSNAREVRDPLASQLGFVCRGDQDASYDEMLNACASRLFGLMRDEAPDPRDPLRAPSRGRGARR